MAGLNFHNKFKEVKTTFFFKKNNKKINIKWYFMRALLNVNHKLLCTWMSYNLQVIVQVTK